MNYDLKKNIINNILHEIPNCDFSLFHGKSGILVSLVCYLKTEKNLDSKERSYIEMKVNECIEFIIEDVENYPMDGSLASGLTGIAYALQIAKSLGGYDVIENDWFKSFDDIIISSFENNLKVRDYDLLRGATGNLLYLLNFCPDNRNYVEAYIRSLFKDAIWVNDDTCYWIFYSFNGVSKQLEYNSEVINIGLAHGIASIISLLSELYETGFEKEKCYKLISGAVNYLRSIEMTDSINHFDGIVYLKEKGISSRRLGWCYGDTSTGLAILKAGSHCCNEDWIDYGNQICLNSTKRTLESSFLEEHGLCHGYFGTMHIFNRLYKRTGKVEYLEMMKYWRDAGETIRDYSCDSTGFFQTELTEDNLVCKFSTPSLIQGLSGILLCLTSTEEIIYPWDKIFLLNI